MRWNTARVGSFGAMHLLDLSSGVLKPRDPLDLSLHDSGLEQMLLPFVVRGSKGIRGFSGQKKIHAKRPRTCNQQPQIVQSSWLK